VVSHFAYGFELREQIVDLSRKKAAVKRPAEIVLRIGNKSILFTADQYLCANEVSTLEKLIEVGNKEMLEIEAKLTLETSFDALEREVLSALQNLGCARATAEKAIQKVKECGAPDAFEPYFRAALAAVR